MIEQNPLLSDSVAMGGVEAVPPGCSALVEALDRAVELREVGELTRAVEHALVDVIVGRRIELPRQLRERCSEGYARRLVYRSPDRGYTVLAMVWGPGQATPIHDHDGIWCVEGVLEGRIEVTQYSLEERDGGRFCFRTEGNIRAGVGSAGRLIPPYDYHTIANPDGEDAITLHVYGKELRECHIFERGEGDWYRAATRQLTYTA